MAESDCEMMEVSYAESASKAFWKPYVRDAKLDEASVFSSGYTGCLSKSAGPRGEDVSCKVRFHADILCTLC